ncbi:MAG: peptide MFS transporter [Gammaproteobacteria bacterium]|nr:peptide MFS transporter [Gammaproteobacteria bacterium]MYE51010.1 peptide MFS transporter [Gammaproteobacteria bacterium]MYF52080.1 peptide MFS transporter [Gammaproteobacteria bacterium]MYH16546.1 peptide MFS transporter [Gammaproteobacteria bacterium]MYK81882.1 peptide MFS transporter [Gammaproteobacteria bacterium]
MHHPKGLWLLFIAEMWERFSYYGMRALLVLYLISSTSAELAGGAANLNPGFGWSEESAYLLYGIYTWAVYLTPIVGGWLADRFLGTHRSMIVGGWIIAAGHILLAGTELFGITAGAAVTLQTGPGALLCFVGGLALIVIGTGFFKPCVSVMVGQLYGPNDERRDGGFTIFYMGINVGALLAPLIAGTLGETVGWHWGFGSAAIGMILGITLYQAFRSRYLEGIGLPPKAEPKAVEEAAPRPPLSRVEWQRIGVILVLAFVANIAFWAAFEQAGSSMNVFAAQNTDRTLWGLLDTPFPATWYQSVNPAAIIIFAPVFAWLWVFLNHRGLNPSTPTKFALGLWLLGLAFLSMVFGAMDAQDGLAAPHWLLITFVVYTWGELCLSPVGLSMVTKLAPVHLQSLMMGLWFFSFSLSNLLAGLVARYSVRLESGEATFLIEGLPGFYLLLVVAPIATGFLIWFISPTLRRWMHGVQ